MGGLIVKEVRTHLIFIISTDTKFVKALVNASRGRPSEKNVSSSTIGMLFFGVPHRGLRSEELSSIIRDKPNEVIIESLKPESPYLDSMGRSFAEVAGSIQWKIWSYWETQLSNTVRVSINIPFLNAIVLNAVLKEVNGSVKLDGPKAVLVSKGSATACSTDTMQYPIDRTHSDMVKFEEGCEDYRRVRDGLLDLEKTATEVMELGAI